MPPPRVLLVVPERGSPFIEQDIRILSEWCQVHPLQLEGVRKWHTAARVFRALVNREVDLLVCWFIYPEIGPIVARLARTFGAPLVAITGGVDATYVPAINWGWMGDPAWRRQFRRVAGLADLVLPFSNSARAEVLRYAPRARASTFYPGIDTGRFRPHGCRGSTVLTVCYVIDAWTMEQKGLRHFLDVARQLPEIPFTLVGAVREDYRPVLEAVLPGNVHLTGRLSDADLDSQYQSASVYVQLSVHEGFGVAVAEAMACGCIPVVSDRGALPEVVGSCGQIVPFGDVTAAVDAVQRALSADQRQRGEARQRVVDRFPIERRRDGWRKLLGHFGLVTKSVRIDLGCGSNKLIGAVGVDQRLTPAVNLVSRLEALALGAHTVDELSGSCILEHFDDPHLVLNQVTRTLRPDGVATFRLPNLGTYSAHLDQTHRFLADLKLWRTILDGYFAEVIVVPVGTKYRDNRLLVGVNNFLVRQVRLYELAQGWDFVCRRPRATPVRPYTPWYLERGNE
jgi:glycosyltransferase involved in cell wall biosynthesis